MIYALSDNIISPLGAGTGQNLNAVLSGKSGLEQRCVPGLPYPVNASLMEGDFEDLVFRSASASIADAGINPSGADVVFILSTTKGEIEKLVSPGVSAGSIAARLGITTCPIVVCNACASGVAALVLALRLLDSGAYSYAVVAGADVPQRFIFSGFGALQSLSSEPCRPFDIERNGLNLGTAAASVVFGREPFANSLFTIESGALRNDAHHISTPSPKGEGLYLAATAAMEEAGVQPGDITLVNAHGTATLFNDQMESVAFERAGLSKTPLNALKAYFGHTLGAAGLVETIITAAALREGVIPGTAGFAEAGVSGKINVVKEKSTASGRTFLKTVSGFGGCNAAVVGQAGAVAGGRCKATAGFTEKAHVRLDPVTIGPGGLNEAYKRSGFQWPRFYKMDQLSKLGFLAAEQLLKDAPEDAGRTVILFNRSSSLHTDRQYLQSLDGPEGFYPSPSVFVYTLPNIVTGEIALRFGLHGETSFYILPQRNDAVMQQVLAATLQDKGIRSAVYGWLDYEDEAAYEADFYLIEKK